MANTGETHRVIIELYKEIGKLRGLLENCEKERQKLLEMKDVNETRVE